MRDLAPSEDLDGFSLYSLSEARMQPFARRQVDIRGATLLQYRFDVNQVERIEPGHRVGFDENIYVAAVAVRVTRSRPEEIERPNPTRPRFRCAATQFRQSPGQGHGHADRRCCKGRPLANELGAEIPVPTSSRPPRRVGDLRVLDGGHSGS